MYLCGVGKVRLQGYKDEALGQKVRLVACRLIINKSLNCYDSSLIKEKGSLV